MTDSALGEHATNVPPDPIGEMLHYPLWHALMGRRSRRFFRGAEIPDGVFNIELWVMEFDDPTFATATAISMSNSLMEPLGIVSSEGGGIDTSGITMVNSGFVRDRSIPEGDAATVVVADGSTVYAARVYANGPAPTPVARDLVQGMIAAEPGDDAESVSGNDASGGVWDVFPQSGDDLLHGLEPVSVRFTEPRLEPMSTPVG